MEEENWSDSAYMVVRESIANWMIGTGRKLGRSADRELAVGVSDHSINIKMVDPDAETYAWDDNLYKYGNLFYRGYSNPIKPTINHNKSLENPDQVDVTEGTANETTDDDGIDRHIQMMSPPRYREYMRQDLMSQLLNPKEQWKKIFYVLLAVSGFLLVNVMLSAAAAGLI